VRFQPFAHPFSSHPLATLQDIADEVGVTRMTASRVLNGGYTPTRSDGLRRAKQIRATAERLGYRPNTAAQSTRTGKFNCMAILSPMSIGGFLPPTLLIGLDMAMRERNLHLSISDLPPGINADDDTAPKFLRELLADGLLLNFDPTKMPPGLAERIEQQNIPSVWINMPRKHDTIQPDDAQGAAWATRTMVERGARRLLMLTHADPNQRGHISLRERERGFTQAAQQAGRTGRVLPQPPDGHEHAALDQLIAMFKSADRPDAVYAYEALEAGRAMLAAAYAGLRVPHDVQVIVTSDAPPRHAGLTIATAQIPFGEIGKEAVDMLAQKVSRPDAALPPRIVKYLHLLEGSTLLGA